MRMPGRVKARPAARFVPAPGRAGRAAKRGASRPPTPRRVQERRAPPREPLASRNWRVLRQQVLHLGLQQVAHRQAEGEWSPTVGLLERAEPRPSRVVRLKAIGRLAFPLVDQVEEIAIARLEPDEIRVEVRQVIEEPAEEVGKVLPPDDEGLAIEAERELVEFAIEEPFGEGGWHMDEPAPSDARHLPQEAARIIGMLQHPDGDDQIEALADERQRGPVGREEASAVAPNRFVARPFGVVPRVAIDEHVGAGIRPAPAPDLQDLAAPPPLSHASPPARRRTPRSSPPPRARRTRRSRSRPPPSCR